MYNSRQKKQPSNLGNDHGAINVLVARFSAPGNVAMTVPVVYSACRCYPDVHFVMLTTKELVSMFVNAPQNLTVLGIDIYGEYKGIRNTRKLVRYICSRYAIDTFINLHDSIRGKFTDLYMRLKGIRVERISGRSGGTSLTRRHGKVMLPLITQRARYREAFFRAGLPVQERFEGVYGRGGKAPSELYAQVTGAKDAGEVWIGVAPFAVFAQKEYPAQLMHQVLERIGKMAGVRFFFFGGGPDEARRADNLATEFDGSVSMVDKGYGFDTELALMSHLDVMLTMDSVNMHLASLAGVRTVVVWGSTHPYCGYKGWHQSDRNAVQLPLTCRPCSLHGNKGCFRGDFLCMNAIRPETIVNKIIEQVPALSAHTTK